MTCRSLTQADVHQASDAFIGTCGESATARAHKFMPAFMNPADGRVEIARLANGQPAPIHLIAALPAEWATRRDAEGRVLELLEHIVAGFVRNDRFYTRAEAAAAS